jgi:uncharacterized protein (TIGR03435 family)
VPLFVPFIAIFLIAAAPLGKAAQQLANTTFEVSSVKASPPDASQGSFRRMDAGIVSVRSMTLKEVVAWCFNLRPYQILGGPDWASKQRFDIVGKDPANNTSSRNRNDRDFWIAVNTANSAKMRGLLKERFSLQYHDETRLMPGFVLLTTKGSQFDPKPCPATYRLQHGWVDEDIHMASLAALLKADLGEPVEDKTGLSGCYHLQAKWTTDPSDTSLSQIPTALHDLGLRLHRAKIDTDVLVIDQSELPKPD